MIDWNNNGKIDPEEVVLTDVILNSEEEEEKSLPKHGGCLTAVMLLPILLIRALFS